MFYSLNYQHVVRRPYPTDMELRSGWLSRAELPLAQQLQHVTAQSSGQCAASGQATPSQGQAAGMSVVFSGRSTICIDFNFVGQFSWSAGGEVVMGVGGGAPPVPIDTGRGMGDEVEVMSTDSSSSSSTDSN